MFHVGYVTVKKVHHSKPSAAMDVASIRLIASSVQGVREISLNERSKVISFLNVDWDCRINVYYTTGTVGTCLNHPYSGKTQLFRRNVDYALLKRIFQEPRVHTGDGYYRTDTAPPRAQSKAGAQKVIFEELEDEETELRRQLEFLQPQVDLINAQLSVLAARRVAAERERERVQQQEEEARRREAAEREALRLRQEQARAEARRQAEEEEQRRIAEEEREELAEQARRAKVARSRQLNARGNNCDYRLSYIDHFPQSMADVACVAISNDGYVAVTDSGSCGFHGIDAALAAELRRQQLSHLAYIAAGSVGQYYIRKTNGNERYYGSSAFMNAIKNSSSAARLVAFGDFDTFFIEYLDGSRQWSRGLDDLIDEEAFDLLKSASLTTVWLGSERHHSYSSYCSNIGYYIGYGNGGFLYANLPSDLQRWMDEKKPSTKIKQVLADEVGNFFVRFS